MIQTLYALKYIKYLNPVNQNDILAKEVVMPPFREPHITKTLIFDMDETLMHCVDNPDTDNPQVVLRVVFPNGEEVDVS
jgi:hypothetical protein